MAAVEAKALAMGLKPQWSPVLETGNGLHDLALGGDPAGAAMEPGLGDREWRLERTGLPLDGRHAAMEPGLGDREWESYPYLPDTLASAAMEPGLGDREWPDG